MKHFTFLLAAILVSLHARGAEIPRELRVGRAGHAFDHLGAFSFQADAAAASGATIIYTGGLGGAAYSGLPAADEFASLLKSSSNYNRHAKEHGIELAIGYLCATSIVNLNTFDKNWSPEFRAQFAAPPAEWRQQDRHGQPLKSWYGGDYEPACMNNPDWRTYQHAMVRHQLETGHDGVFFDNPTVHTQGCYCAHCMRAFAKFCADNAPNAQRARINNENDVDDIRALADANPKLFLQFRATIARDFLADMRAYARTINPRALITCNNSLNSPDALYAQSRSYAYNIYELSKAEDYVVVEDMATQPRVDADGRTIEYGSTYEQLHAISHGKPIVAVTLANADYHTPPNLVRLAMAEAAAHRASYLSWPTWPEDQRARMIDAIRPQTEFLRQQEAILNDTNQRADVNLFLPFRRWIETDRCAASNLAATLTIGNVQHRVICEDDFESLRTVRTPTVLLVESMSVLTPDEKALVDQFTKSGSKVVAADSPEWLSQVHEAMASPSIKIDGPPTVRAVIQDQPNRTIVHLYNLNVQRLSSFADKVTPANNVSIEVTVPFPSVQSLRLESADADATTGSLSFNATPTPAGSRVTFTVPRLVINAIAIIE